MVSIIDKITAGKQMKVMDFYSDPTNQWMLSTVAGNYLAEEIVVALPAGAVISKVYALLHVGNVESTFAGVNSIAAVGNHGRVKILAGAWGADDIKAIPMVANNFKSIAVDSKVGHTLFGNLDLSSKVVGNGTYNFRLDQVTSVQDNLVLQGNQWQLKIYYY